MTTIAETYRVLERDTASLRNATAVSRSIAKSAEDMFAPFLATNRLVADFFAANVATSMREVINNWQPTLSLTFSPSVMILQDHVAQMNQTIVSTAMAAFSDTLRLDWEGILKNVRFDAVAWQPYEWEPLAPRVMAFDGITPAAPEAQRETTLAVEALRADLALRADAKELRERVTLWLLFLGTLLAISDNQNAPVVISLIVYLFEMLRRAT